jgi:ABC-2 type transport system permease protein
MGKILAMMCYTLLMIVGMVTGFLISNAFTSTFILKGKQGAAAQMASALNLETIFAVLSPLNIVILVSFILLAYLACSVLTGILASSCSRQEEVGGTISGTTTITMIGYFVGIFSMQIDKEIVHIVSALVPVVGCFTSPVNYIVGNINLGIFLLSLLIQLVTVAFMMWLCGKVYKKVLVHEGKSLKLFDLFGLMKK